MSVQTNKDIVKELRERISDAVGLLFVEYHGLNADQVNELRAKLSEQGAKAFVTKNTLLKIAMKEEKLNGENVEKTLTGPTMTVFAHEDTIATIKALYDFAKEYELPRVKAGIVDGTFTNEAKLEILSNLPSKEELQTKVVVGLISPITGFVNLMGGVQRNFVYALSAIADEKSE